MEKKRPLQVKRQIGVETNTYSIVGRCQRTGMLGMAGTTSDIALGSRCPHVKPLIGAVTTQASTDPRLGSFALRLMSMGYSAPAALDELSRSDPHIERRQLGLVDADGNVAARTGALNQPWAGHQIGDGYVALGNGLVGEQVVGAMAAAFEKHEANDLEDRLFLALESGLAAGGEKADMTPWHSAAILVYGNDPFPRVDLRVDEHLSAVVELRRVLDIYRQRLDFFILRAKDPGAARSVAEESQPG